MTTDHESAMWAELRECASLFALIQKGMKSGHIADATLILPTAKRAKSLPLVSLSSLVSKRMKALSKAIASPIINP